MINSKEEILNTYNQRIANFTAQKNELDKIINLISYSRFGVFILGGIFVWYFAVTNTDYIIYTLALSLIVFLSLVKYHESLLRKFNFLQSLITINREELLYLDGRWTKFEDGHKYLKKSSLHALDLDVFGQDSLFQKINRTSTLSGRNRLAHWFLNPKQSIESIKTRQKAIQELKDDIDFRQNFRAIGLSSAEHSGDYVRMIRWMKHENWVTAKPIYKWLIFLLPIINFSITVLSIIGLLPWSATAAAIILTLAFLAPFQKKINKSYLLLTRRAAILVKYVDLLKTVENKEFKTDLLLKLQSEMADDHKKAWQHIGDLTRILQMLDQRLNMLVGVLLNVYLMWDFKMLYKVEVWKKLNSENLVVWFNNIGFFDAFCSLSNLAFNEPEWVFAQCDNSHLVTASQLRHPLMKYDDCVPNDISISQRPYFQVITGANMAGKSTWLRTVGSNLLLAMMGSVVNAKSFAFTPTFIASSLHTADSLMKNESYFYSELKRLQEIIRLIQNEDKVFVLLDEILKGTNSGDKEAGSIALIKQLIDLKGYGIIATHDLNLAKISDNYQQYTDNYRFEAEIIDDKLFFDFKLKEGIAQNFNATYLMKKMGITL